ncbi:LOW QUALITY PROTEIN: Hypothetical protein PHPALM_13027 [Phytophthora palmivora]|uniref:Tc1-like transposase DDE domain-containing protein n=1 Tax=Phytophthora palmivora TaxID=4796 RepID=A0A2P4XY92_9STRA|nr:LOW QUALITY PROTEIN: Hypothetical protein PHPALM_13027 [Phytophthora palmivora]
MAKKTEDYHGMFDSNYFERWMENLLRILSSREIEHAVIVLDNAKYHKRLPKGTPTGSTKESEMQAKCEEYDIAYKPTELKAALWSRLEPYIQQHVKPVVVTMAETKGHKVLFTPPHHSDLQPIETVWVVLKIGRQYTADTTFQQVLQRLEASFCNLTSAFVAGCIRKTNKQLDTLYRQLHQIEENEDSSDDSGSDSKSGTDSNIEN